MPIGDSARVSRIVRAGMRWTLLLGVLAGLVACATQTRVSETTTDEATIRRLAVLPFRDMTDVFGDGIGVRSPLTGKFFVTGPVPDDAAAFLTEQTHALLAARAEYDLLPLGRAEGAKSKILSVDGSDGLDALSLAMRIGADLGVDAVVVGHVFRFADRVGNPYSVSEPASVAFDLQLVQVDSGKLLWRGHMDETQMALSDDLFQLGRFIRRGGRWVRAREMAESGLTAILESFP